MSKIRLLSAVSCRVYKHVNSSSWDNSCVDPHIWLELDTMSTVQTWFEAIMSSALITLTAAVRVWQYTVLWHMHASRCQLHAATTSLKHVTYVASPINVLSEWQSWNVHLIESYFAGVLPPCTGFQGHTLMFWMNESSFRVTVYNHHIESYVDLIHIKESWMKSMLKLINLSLVLGFI